MTMKCDESLPLISPYLDHELDPARSAEVESHLHACDGCASVLKELEALRAAISGASLPFASPPDLERRVRLALRREAGAGSFSWLRRWRWPVITPPMGFAAAALAAVLLLLTWGNSSRWSPDLGSGPLLTELVAGHVRSLMVDHLVDVASSDQHTVKPWFNGKVDFAPPVADFTADGFPLLGGRLDYIAGRPAAALVYQHRQHLVNVFVWPSDKPEDSATIQTFAAQGYHLLHWTRGGLAYWAVSDLNPTDMQSLAHLIQSTG